MWFLLCSALAAPPLAIPAGDGIPQREPFTEAQLEALETFKAERLTVLTVRDYAGGTSFSTSYGYPWWGPWWSVSRTAYWAEDTWAVYEGPRRLPVPEYVGMVRSTAERRRVQGRITRNHIAGWTLWGIGVSGAIATLVGVVEMDTARADFQYETGALIATTGSLAMIGGLLTSGFPLERARRLREQPHLLYDLEEIQGDVFQYNEGLRKDLGLSPAQVADID